MARGDRVSTTETPTEHFVETVGRPHPARQRPEVYPLTGVATARYADLDPNAHLNNVALESMHEDLRAVLTDQVFPGIHNPEGRRLRVVNSQTVVHFLAEARWPCLIDTGIGVARVGRTSFVLSSALFHDGKCVSLCDAVMVVIADRPEPLSDAARRGLQQLQLRSPSIDGSLRIGRPQDGTTRATTP
jgi:acyl-CoA thioester hydrolase